jgi:GxxExxY protein
VERENLNKLSEHIIGAATAVHRELGPGLLESVYEACLAMELRRIGLPVQMQLPIPVAFRGQIVSEDGLRLDLLVAETVILEIKSVESFHPVHKKQLLTYLRLANKPLGLLINFNVPLLKDGIERIINIPL